MRSKLLVSFSFTWRLVALVSAFLLVAFAVLVIGAGVYSHIERPRENALTVAQDEQVASDDNLEGNAEGAYVAASQCISLNRSDFRCWVARGLAEYSVGRCDMAKSDLNQAATLATSTEQVNVSAQTFVLLTTAGNNCNGSPAK